uniref:Reverse transcriptase domain-containing protein n=1 Tax=Paramormyrops kingsleyae TaxID=1676925 RepID=A0A3B3QXJ1_9TELE
MLSAYDVILLDFQKAFDVVPHKRLLLNLKAAGILGIVAAWTKNWLTDRNIHSGVPQGSILGPLLFLIYINDIDTNTYSKLVKLADDTKVGGVADTEVEAQHTLQWVGAPSWVVPCIAPVASGIGSGPPVTLNGISSFRKWMDGHISIKFLW